MQRSPLGKGECRSAAKLRGENLYSLFPSSLKGRGQGLGLRRARYLVTCKLSQLPKCRLDLSLCCKFAFVRFFEPLLDGSNLPLIDIDVRANGFGRQTRLGATSLLSELFNARFRLTIHSYGRHFAHGRHCPVCIGLQQVSKATQNLLSTRSTRFGFFSVISDGASRATVEVDCPPTITSALPIFCPALTGAAIIAGTS